MGTLLIVMQFVPLIAYLTVDYKYGFRKGIYAAFVATAVMLAFDFSIDGELDRLSMCEAGLIFVMGLISLKMDNPKYFKFQPSVVALVFGMTFGYFQIVDRPVMVQFIPKLEKMYQTLLDEGHIQHPEMRANIENALLNMQSEQTKDLYSDVSFNFIIFFLIHGSIMAYAALRLSTNKWFVWRMAQYPGYLIVLVISMLQNQA